MRAILDIRCEEEDAELGGDARELLTKIATETSLRYAIQLISAAAICAARRKAAEVGVDDVARAYGLFIDVKRSTQFMLEYQEQYMYNEVPGGEGEEDAEEGGAGGGGMEVSG